MPEAYCETTAMFEDGGLESCGTDKVLADESDDAADGRRDREGAKALANLEVSFQDGEVGRVPVGLLDADDVVGGDHLAGDTESLADTVSGRTAREAEEGGGVPGEEPNLAEGDGEGVASVAARPRSTGRSARR
jgi:hypothetical protein